MTDSVWREFFDSYAPQYVNEVFTADSVREVEFLVEVLGLPAGAAILDVGCGTGRHAVELARRGYRVTGLDLSAGMLAEAAKAAEEAGVDGRARPGRRHGLQLGARLRRRRVPLRRRLHAGRRRRPLRSRSGHPAQRARGAQARRSVRAHGQQRDAAHPQRDAGAGRGGRLRPADVSASPTTWNGRRRMARAACRCANAATCPAS